MLDYSGTLKAINILPRYIDSLMVEWYNILMCRLASTPQTLNPEYLNKISQSKVIERISRQ